MFGAKKGRGVVCIRTMEKLTGHPTNWGEMYKGMVERIYRAEINRGGEGEESRRFG